MVTVDSAIRRGNKAQRMGRVGRLARGKFVAAKNVPDLLKRIIEPGDIVCLEGDNQKQADFLANQLASLDKKDLHDIHLVMSCITLPAHIALFKKGMVRQVDFCYAGPQGAEVAQLVKAGKFPVGAIHTYNELYARYYVDLTPRVALIAAAQADHQGNLYLAANTEETPAIANLAACRSIAERQAAIRAVAGYTPVGLKRSKRETQDLRARGIVQLPEDVGVSPARAHRGMLAAQDIKGLVRWSKGLYDPPSQFVDW